MGLPRSEVNLRRLLAKCELYAKENHRRDDKVEKCLESIDDLLLELEKRLDKPDPIKMAEYYERLETLKDKLVLKRSASSKVPENTTRKKFVDGIEEKPPLVKNTPVFPGAVKDTKAGSWSENRRELLGIKSGELSQSTIVDDSNVDMLLKHHDRLQDNIVDEMLSLTASLKEQSEVAGKIIRNDTALLTKSSNLTASNLNNLKTESEKLEEHSKRAWKCWLWVMIFIVMVIFINMVLFMKVMKKRS